MGPRPVCASICGTSRDAIPALGSEARAVAHREGLVTNPKRTQRIWRDERLQRPPQRRAKRRRLTDGTAARLRAQCPNDVWALDFCFDETADLRRIKLLNVVDEFTREALAIDAAHSIDSDGVTATVERLVASRGAPAHLRMDNGPRTRLRGAAGLVQNLGHPHRLHRARIALGDTLRGVLQRPAARPVPQRRGLHQHPRSPSDP